MWAYVLRRLLYSIPVYLGIVLFVMAALRVNDPVWAFLGKKASAEQYQNYKEKMGLNKPFLVQYASFIGRVATLDFEEKSWDKPTQTVRERLSKAVGPTLAITVPSLVITTVLAIFVALLASYFRGLGVDQWLMLASVLGMSISYLVYVVFGQYWGAYLLKERWGNEVFAISGYQPGLVNWPHYCLLPVLIGVTVALGYDTRYYRAVMVEETNKDYILTAKAKGASKPKIMFVHMLKNAMIPIITRIMITVPFLLEGSIVLERYFNIPGMGNVLIDAINSKDFPVIQAFAAIFAAIFIVSNILTDVLYALVDPRVRLR
jgi:peptide/nickel transport system permease protein